MRIDLAGLAARLERGLGEEVLRRAAERGAAGLAEEVRARLSGTPGGAHEAPWVESGALRDSIGTIVEGDGDGARAVVGTSDPAAVPQEMGTAHMPARPFLAPVAGEMGEEAARAAGAVVRAALRGEGGEDSAVGAPAGSGIVQVSADGMDLPRAAGAALVLGAVALYLRQQQEGAARRALPGQPATLPEMPHVVEAAVPLPPPKEGETPLDVLKPGGQNVGERGDNSKVRILPGGLDGARELFDRLTKRKGGEDVTPPGRQGQVIRLPDGSYIGLRPKSKSGPPTVDVNVAGTGVRELKFPEGKVP